MHYCGTCLQPCTCGGDTSQDFSAEVLSCTCCPARCIHGIDLEEGCAECLLEQVPIAEVLDEEVPAEAPPAFMNGGW